MGTKDNKKVKLLYIKHFLETQTDEMHPATITDILAYLGECGVIVSRKTVAGDIELLIESGVDVVCNKSRQNQYFVGTRHLELPELKLLVDAVQASKLISLKKSTALIQKLAALASVHQADELNRHLYVDKQIKPNNEKVYITLDLLYSAISAEKQVRFKYYEYTQSKKKVYKHNGKIYIFSPYGLMWNYDHYYVAGFSDSHGKVVTFRVDRIASPKITDAPIVPRPVDFDMAEYAKSVFLMYDGPMRRVTLKCENTLMKTIIDRFGEDVDTEPLDNGHFCACVRVSISQTFYGWVFSFGGSMEIISPEDIAGQYISMAKLIAGRSR